MITITMMITKVYDRHVLMVARPPPQEIENHVPHDMNAIVTVVMIVQQVLLPPTTHQKNYHHNNPNLSVDH